MKKIFKWILVIFIFLVFMIIYARYIGTLNFITKEYTITDENMMEGFDGLKIVHFSDLHYNRAISINKVKSIVDEINLINPDIVVFTGDLIDKDVILTDKDYKNLTNLLSLINTKYGKYAVMGNHDYQNKNITEIYHNSNFKYLVNDYDIIYNRKNEAIFIGGIGNVSYGLDDIDKTMEYTKNNQNIQYKIVLVHEPDITDQIVNNYNVNLILAGHSHNGQIRLPIIGAIYTPPYAKKYYDNFYDINGTKLYISSGIGVSSVNYRLWNKPSINFYRINKDSLNN